MVSCTVPPIGEISASKVLAWVTGSPPESSPTAVNTAVPADSRSDARYGRSRSHGSSSTTSVASPVPPSPK